MIPQTLRLRLKRMVMEVKLEEGLIPQTLKLRLKRMVMEVKLVKRTERRPGPVHQVVERMVS